MARALDKCEYCRMIGYHCKERRCGIEYAKYAIMVQALIDFINQPIDARVSVDNANVGIVRNAVRELKLMRRSGSLFAFIIDRVVPYADKLMDKSEYCNAVSAITNCDVEYMKYVIMYYAITDFINQPIDMRVYVDGVVDGDVIRVASRELRTLKRMGGLLRFIRDRVVPYVVVSRD